jgi:hypothetical protein
MDVINNLLERKWVLPVAALVIGIVLGLLYAWIIDPVDWINGIPEQMRVDLRKDYLRMIVDSYSVNNDADLAVARYKNLGIYAQDTLEAVGEEPGNLSSEALQNFRAAIEIFTPELPDQSSSAENGGSSSGGSIIDSILKILPIFCAASAVVVVVGIVVVVLRRRSERVEEEYPETYISEPEYGYEPEELDLRFTEAMDRSVGEPLATFRTIYSLGDDLYDDSFSIESPTGDFLGECGVGIGDIIGVGDPKKVSAFEVWLFDKNDIQTVTKVLMSNYAYNDDDTRSRLAAKGDPILAESGGIIDLDTASLRVEARIVDLTYGEGALPSGSFFERIAIELRAFQLM